MLICQINVLNNKIDKIIYAYVSKLHEYCNKFDGKSLIKIFLCASGAQTRFFATVNSSTI